MNLGVEKGSAHSVNMLYTFKDPMGREYAVDIDDKRFRIKSYQHMLSSCTGALLTSLLSEYNSF